jgi:RPA family protein
MSESGDSGPGRREVAHRLFAAEFDDADFSYSESDEERAPNYVVTPTGARVNRLFLVGVLTELEQVNDDVLRARVVDPTGPFVIYAGQYQPDELAFLEAADPPMFVAVTGKARTFQPDDSDRVFTSVRPESISEVDGDTRDRWVVQAAEQTVSRIGRMASAKQAGLAGDELRLALLDQGIDESAAAGITLALDHYDTTGDYLDALRTTALDAARVVAGDTDEAEGLSLSPSDGTDDPIPLLASLDLDTDASTPVTTTDEAGGDTPADEPAAESEVDEPSAETPADEPVSERTESDTATDEPAAEPTTETVSEDDTTETTIDEEPAVSETTSAPETETVDSEPEPSTPAASASEPEPSSGTDADRSSETAAESDLGADTTEPETATSTAADSDTAAEGDGDLGEFDPEFELDEDEREEIEQEYGTDFQTGTEVEEPGEAGIETPDLEEAADEADAGAPADAANAEPARESTGAPTSDESPEPDASAATSDAPAETPETATGAGADETTAGESAGNADETADDDAADVDLEDAVMEVMDELDDGSGADREELLAAVVDRYGADADAVDDAIQDALMGGRCYEPDDGKLTPI